MDYHPLASGNEADTLAFLKKPMLVHPSTFEAPQIPVRVFPHRFYIAGVFCLIAIVQTCLWYLRIKISTTIVLLRCVCVFHRAQR
jgi:hypothetical protein